MITDIETAKAVVLQIYPDANEPLLSLELQGTKGTLYYRAYYVAAKFIGIEYQKVTKADEVTFDYDKETSIRSLLNTQSINDKSDTVADNLSASALLDAILCPNNCGGVSSDIGVMIY